MLSLLLVVGLCSAEPGTVCSYMDVTQRMQVTTDAECYATAVSANEHNVATGQTPRYDCVQPAKYLTLIGVTPAPEVAQPGRVL